MPKETVEDKPVQDSQGNIRVPKLSQSQDLVLNRSISIFPDSDPVPAGTVVAKITSNELGLPWIADAIRSGLIGTK